MKRVQNILERKGTAVSSIGESATVLEAAREMNRQRIGSLVVLKGDDVIGIFSERDILTRVVAVGLDPATTAVNAVMTTPVACCKRESSLEECKAVMTELRVRHLPVVDEGRLQGIVTAGDLMAFEAKEHEHTIEHLYHYLYGTSP
ncbi:MAG: CBS domain-containing protein [Candidatus Krumholzibacteriia bacterium]|nr:CBS domain-containing protein [bacterium]MCB9514237.1 CBS domain-containing protein [Candidatus Latescibacterota bacterium]MCB9515906.1 CBS domain-containing protein [Candidatus Latescibacterota bacterium]